MFRQPRDEQGISEVLGAILVIGALVPAISLAYAIYVQSATHSSEADHMDDVQSKFLQMKSEIESMKAGELGSVNIPMNTDFPLFVLGRGETGALSIKPGQASAKGGSSYSVGEGEVVLGSLDALRVDDEIYFGINQMIYSEKFPDTSGWSRMIIEDDPNTFTPAFDIQASDFDDGTGSIHVSCAAWSTNNDKEETAYWTHYFSPLDNLDNTVSVQGWFRKIMSFVKDPADIKVLMRIDIENKNNKWENGVIRFTSDNADSTWWTKTENVFYNGVRAIRAYISGAENASSGAFSQAYLDLWWDDIALWKGPPFEVDITIVSSPVFSPENVENIIVKLDFCSKVNPSLENLYIRNYSKPEDNGGWELLRSDIVDPSPDTRWENTVVNADNYIKYDGTIRIRIKGHNDNSLFTLALDYLEFQLEPRIPSENFLAYYTGSGDILFKMNNNYYPDQNFIYEDGAVILAQDDSSIMVSGPRLVVVQPVDNLRIKVSVNHLVLTGPVDSIARAGWSTVSYEIVDNFYVAYTGDVPENEKVVITIDSIYVNAWKSYLSGLVEEFNKENYNADLDENLLGVIPRLTLTINGKDNNGVDNDIYYCEKVTKIQVNLA